MGICATPDCGIPGRPFPACDMCRQRLYCGSHCLFNLDDTLQSKLQHAQEHDHVTIVKLLNDDYHSFDRLREARVICPPCKARFQPLFDWLSKGDQQQADVDNYFSDLFLHPSDLDIMPQLIVFDLDECLWSPEMYTLDEIPTKTVVGPLHGHGEGVIAAKSGHKEIRLFPDALKVLQAIHLNYYGDNLRIAAASSADTPHAVRIAHAAMSLLDIVPGVSMREVFNRGFEKDFDGNIQIGRTPPLSSDKSKTHFPILQQQTGIPYSHMLFFDDCNWGDNCGQVARHCPGVVTKKTPHGLQVNDWNEALLDFAQRYGH